ncbi:MAG TPA: hypothetical protein DDZ67_10250 [Xanthomonadaceae bacterium]|nr:hypothetical protein [Xanthomonadaceae bacterium]
MRPWTLADGSPLLQGIGMAIAPDGAVWLGRSSGKLSRRDPGDGLTRDVAEVPAGARVLVFDRDGALWIATGRGAFVLRPGTGRPLAAEGLPVASYDDAAIDRFGRFWMVSSAGLYRRHHGRWIEVEVRGDLPSHDFSRISVAPDGEVWLSLNDAGLWHGRLDRKDVLTLRKVQDPLVSQVMPYIVRHDRRGWLWLGSSQGIDLYRDGRWVRVTQAEGLLWDDLAANAFFEDLDGSIWIGSSRGVSRIFDPRALFASHPLRLRITQVKRDLQPVHPGQSLLWSEAPLEVDLATPGASGGRDRFAFRYRVKGLQAQWTGTDSSHITYPVLSPGRYALEAQALDSRQRTASDIATFPFEIFPPWWRSPFAILAYLLAAAGAVTLLLRWRVGHLRARERELERLVAERTLELEQDKLALEAARAALAIKATRDELTGLLNRTGILEVMHAQMIAAERDGQPLAAVLIDLDHFKQINDQHGHLAGDGVLARVGRRLNACLRGDDRIGRYGGEELLAIMPGLAPGAHNRLRAIHDAVCSAPYAVDERILEVTCSIGVAWYRHGETSAQLLARADEALYRAKHGGRNRIELEHGGATPA